VQYIKVFQMSAW